MFRDRDEELKRLQAELLEEEEQETAEEFYEEEYLEEETVEQILDEEETADATGVYRNFSNDYGEGLRNFASGYKAYNTDKVDEDMEEFSREVMEPPQKKKGWLAAFAIVLLTAVLLLMLWLVAKEGGLL